MPAIYVIGDSAARFSSPGELRKLIVEHSEGRTFGLFGERRVNVLELNLALDKLKGG
jgi:K+-transporting ATPase ATPase C chain